jgi:predicted RNA-binding protein with PUA-like domain
MTRARRYWLVKSEPEVFSFDDLWSAKGRTTLWDGVRNYRARNFLRDEMAVGEGVFFYHSSADPTGIAGVAEVASAAVPDPTQFDPKDDHFDPESPRDAPRWFAVEVRATEKLPRFVTLEELRAEPSLGSMAVLQRGNRLSITPVREAEWRRVRALAGLAPADAPRRARKR